MIISHLTSLFAGHLPPIQLFQQYPNILKDSMMCVEFIPSQEHDCVVPLRRKATRPPDQFSHVRFCCATSPPIELKDACRRFRRRWFPSPLFRRPHASSLARVVNTPFLCDCSREIVPAAILQMARSSLRTLSRLRCDPVTAGLVNSHSIRQSEFSACLSVVISTNVSTTPMTSVVSER